MDKSVETTAKVVITTLFISLYALNALSGVVGGIWLALKGAWGSIVIGFLFSFGMPFAWVIFASPGMLLVPVLGFFFRRGNRIGFSVVGLLGSLYNDLLVLAWSLFVYLFFAKQIASGTEIPMLLWGFSTACAPLTQLRQ